MGKPTPNRKAPDRQSNNAGRPPPLLVQGEQTGFVGGEHDPLLGTGLPVTRSDSVVGLPPGSTLVMYTDGLVEAHGRTVEEGLQTAARQRP